MNINFYDIIIQIDIDLYILVFLLDTCNESTNKLINFVAKTSSET